MATVSDLPYMSDDEYGYFRFNAAIKSAYDYYPFGSLKPGRYTSDTSSNCVTLTQNKWVTKYRTDSVWVDYTLVVRQAPTLLNVNAIANEVVAEANGQGSRITFTGVSGANAIAQAVIPTTVSAGVLQELTLSTVTYDSNMVLSVTEEVNGKEIVLHTGVLAPVMSDAGAQLSTVSILPQTSNIKVKIGPAYILTPGTAVVVDGYWKKVTTPYQEQEQILVTLCDSVGDQYRFGFNGMEKDNELKGVGNSLDFGARIYDSRLGRWLSLDPLATDAPSWTPYAFTLNNPIVFVDKDGKWPGVTYMFFEFDIGGGLAYGLNYVRQEGVAYDEVGKTQFTMVSALYIINQNLNENSPNPEAIAGASVSFGGGITQDWSHETFIGDISNYNGEAGGFQIFAGIGGEIGYGSQRFTAKVGVGVGVKISLINTSISTSISLTDAEADKVNNSTDVVTPTWMLKKAQATLDENGKIIGYSSEVLTKNKKGQTINTGIKVFSGVKKDENGKLVSNGIYTSKAYESEALEAEKNK